MATTELEYCLFCKKGKNKNFSVYVNVTNNGHIRITALF